VLAEQSVDHVVLERGEVADSWRRQRWDSLRLLTPNWQSRLPGYPYSGTNPDGFLTMPEVVEHISRFAETTSAPVRTQTTVTSVRRIDAGYQVLTDGAEIRCRAVVIASGAANIARVPEVSAAVPDRIECVTPFEYHNPERLPFGGVLIVGASATGVQLAHEILRSGRPVTLCVGEHVRLPRTYRGRDVLWWMENSGIWNERYDEIDDLERARRLPSPQLVGTPERITLDLNVLRDAGVEVVGRLATIRDGRALFSGGLANQFALADLKMGRLLDSFDDWARTAEVIEAGPPERFEPTRAPESPRLSLNLRGGEIRSIVWATGFRPDYGWLDVSVLNRKGELRHEGGVVVDAPGMYAIGLPVLRRRKSTFILGAEDDARDIVDYLLRYLAGDVGKS
jgi:putative flavoprotein involved in K+ transport